MMNNCFKKHNEHIFVSPGSRSKFACNFSRQHNFRSEYCLGALKTEGGMSESPPPLNSSGGGSGGHVLGGRGPMSAAGMAAAAAAGTFMSSSTSSPHRYRQYYDDGRAPK